MTTSNVRENDIMTPNIPKNSSLFAPVTSIQTFLNLDTRVVYQKDHSFKTVWIPSKFTSHNLFYNLDFGDDFSVKTPPADLINPNSIITFYYCGFTVQMFVGGDSMLLLVTAVDLLQWAVLLARCLFFLVRYKVSKRLRLNFFLSLSISVWVHHHAPSVYNTLPLPSASSPSTHLTTATRGG